MQYPSAVALRRIRTGRNPRVYFDPTEMAEITESIRANGVYQPILIRPIEDDEFDFDLVAGERRYRGAMDAHGEDWEIPALVKEMTDEEADRAALIENAQRADMSPSEEAAAASKIVGHCKGDREEAARLLGWSRSTLDKRLALMNCSPDVQAH